MSISLESIMKDKILVTFNEEGKNYVLSKDKVLTKNTLFTTLLECIDKDKVLVHNEKTFTYDQFSVIYKILNNEKLTYDSELKDNEDILKYYLINNKDILQSIADIETDKFFFCNTEKKYNEVLEFIKKNKLPYLPFKAAFNKGFNIPELDCEAVEIKKSPIYISFGEYENIFLLKSYSELAKEVNQSKLYKFRNRKADHEYNDDEDESRVYQSLTKYLIDMEENIWTKKFGFENMTGLNQTINRVVRLCGNYSYYIGDYLSNNKNTSTTLEKCKLYHIDSENKLFIPPSYRKKILSYLKEVDFYNNLVKESENKDINIFTTNISMMQEFDCFGDDFIFCISEVYGFVKCDDFIGNTKD